MEQQIQSEGEAMVAKPKSGMAKMIIINVVISLVISSIVAYALVGSLTVRVAALEKQMAKQAGAFKTISK